MARAPAHLFPTMLKHADRWLVPAFEFLAEVELLLRDDLLSEGAREVIEVDPSVLVHIHHLINLEDLVLAQLQTPRLEHVLERLRSDKA